MRHCEDYNMSDNEKILENLISSDIYARYSDLLSLTQITLLMIKPDGKIMFEFIPSPDFCRYICQKEENYVCDDYLNMIKDGQMGCFACKNGLKNILFPIKENDRVVGYITGMQAYSPETESIRNKVDIAELAGNKDLDIETAQKALSEVKLVEDEKRDVHQQLGSYIAKITSEELSEKLKNKEGKGFAQSIEKEILEKKIIDLEAKNNSLMVNPHFLFNTLNCIARTAYFENAQKTEELIFCLSDLLRYNLQKGDQLHTIGTELDNIEKYLYIQKSRFKERLEYEIDVPEHIKFCRVPNMILQPIVENAIMHGTAAKRDGGKINIYAESDNNKNVIFVSDNGNGFSKEVLKHLKSNEKSTSELGFRMTDNRIKQYYGQQYGLEIVKSDFSGSTISITIPNGLIGR